MASRTKQQQRQQHHDTRTFFYGNSENRQQSISTAAFELALVSHLKHICVAPIFDLYDSNSSILDN